MRHPGFPWQPFVYNVVGRSFVRSSFLLFSSDLSSLLLDRLASGGTLLSNPHRYNPHTSRKVCRFTPLALNTSGSILGSEFRISPVSLFLYLTAWIGSSW